MSRTILISVFGTLKTLSFSYVDPLGQGSPAAQNLSGTRKGPAAYSLYVFGDWFKIRIARALIQAFPLETRVPTA